MGYPRNASKNQGGQWPRSGRSERQSSVVVTVPIARAEPQEALAEAPEVREAFNKGEAHFQKGNYQKAIRAFSKAFELTGERSMIALYGLGKTYLRMEKFDKAEDYALEILALGESNVHQSAARSQGLSLSSIDGMTPLDRRHLSGYRAP